MSHPDDRSGDLPSRSDKSRQHETSACIDPVDTALCEWSYDAGNDSVGVPGCWICKTCGDANINRDPPSDPDADAHERTL